MFSVREITAVVQTHLTRLSVAILYLSDKPIVLPEAQ